MANIYEGMNVRQKLAKARLQFLNQKVKKSGKNMHLEFKYFELEDIVPPAIRIFARVGLTTDIDFTDENGAVMRVYNTDNSEEAPIEFRVPYREVKPIVSNAGKEVTNPMQALGSSITYLRRYLWISLNRMTLTLLLVLNRKRKNRRLKHRTRKRQRLRRSLRKSRKPRLHLRNVRKQRKL